ncbi:MAG: Hsp20/alpha crystallin family protein [Gammaproteobacteria bacterium]|nr:Hsp20/alpha crystallin family protein [Gammaproteobacteria bacterium]MCF6364107.1 Hsp20/alpha crystallin family protein [Gammaproteobacteria bacterium]
MTLVRYEPWNVLQQLQREMNSLFDTRLPAEGENGNVATSDWAPAVDIKEEDDRFLVLADIPGVDPEDIEVNMENGILSIKGERKSEHTEEKEGYKRIERAYGSFHRRFTLPESADPEGIKAKSIHGSLEIVIPKREAVQPQRIAVES